MRILISLFLISLQISFSQSWSEKAPIPGGEGARHHPVTFTLGDFGYVVTGVTADNFLLDDFFRYDPETDMWTELEEFPGPARGLSYGDTYQGKAYMGFGIGSQGYLNDLWEYDSETNEWTELTPCPCDGRAHPAFVQTGGKIYVSNGNDDVNDMKDAWEYDIETDTWRQLPDMPGERRHHPYYFAVNGKFYVGFGHHQMLIFDDFYEWDPSMEEWTRMNDFPGEGRVAGTQFNYKGKGYILSGQGEDHQNLDTGEFWEWDPETDSWTELEAHPGTGRWAPGSFIINDELFFLAGRSGVPNGFQLVENTMISYRLNPPASNNYVELIEHNTLLYPNPAKDNINIDLNDKNIQSIKIYDSNGIEVFQSQTHTKSINLENYNSGMYFMEISTDSRTFRDKFIKTSN